MASFNTRLKRCMKRRGMRTADVARWFDRPYTTVREWVLYGREPSGTTGEQRQVERRLLKLESS